MKYHFIQQGYFGDRGYRVLTKDEGYFFTFLWQLPQLSAAGVGHISVAMLAAESYGKFTSEECEVLLGALQARHRVVYDNEWLWVVNYFKFKPGTSSWALISAARSLQECESALIVDGWRKKYGNLERVKKTLAKTDKDATDSRAESDDLIHPADPSVLDGIEAEPPELHLHRAEVDAVWIHYQKKMKTSGFLTPLRRRKILERLRENIVENGVPRVVKVEDLLLAITNCTRSDFHMGRDKKTQGHKYNALETYILGNQEKFLYWLTYQGGPPPAGTAPGEVVYREETPSPKTKWSGERTPPEQVKEITKRLKATLGEPIPGSTERVFRG